MDAARASRARAAREHEVFGGKPAGLGLPVNLAHASSSCRACNSQQRIDENGVDDDGFLFAVFAAVLMGLLQQKHALC